MCKVTHTYFKVNKAISIKDSLLRFTVFYSWGLKGNFSQKSHRISSMAYKGVILCEA